MKHVKAKTILTVLALALSVLMLPVFKSRVKAAEGQTLTSDIKIDGDYILEKGELNLGDYTMTVTGDFIMYNGCLVVGKGSLIIGGDFRIQKPDGDKWNLSDGALQMTDPKGYIEVAGSFITSSTANYTPKTPNNILTAGTIAVAGDFRQEYYGRRDDGFAPEGVKVILNGKGHQQVIHFDKPHFSYFSDLVLENTDIKVETMIRGFKLSEDLTFGNGIPYGTCGTFDLNGKTLTVNGDMVMGENGNNNGDTYGSINVNGGTLNVTGNLTQEAGTLTFGGGKVIVGKDYRLQSTIKDDDGNITGYTYCPGALIMTDPNDTMTVGGGFYTSSDANYVPRNPNNALTAGLIEVAGDFRQEYYGHREDGFPAEGTTVKLNGKAKQTVSFDKPYASCFSDLILENTNVSFDTMIRGWKLSTDITFGNGLPNGTCGTFDFNGKTVKVNGDMVMGDQDSTNPETFGHVLLNGGKLIITGNFRQANGKLDLGGGTVYVEKDYRIQSEIENDGKKEYTCSYGALIMNNPDDLIVVKGSFYTSSIANWVLSNPNNDISAGVMEVGGDFRQEYHGYSDDGFTATGTHTVVLNGPDSIIQTIKFDKFPISTFKNLILTREGPYYKFVNELCAELATVDEDYVSKYTEEDGGSQEPVTPVIDSYTITFKPNGGKINAGDKKIEVKAGSFIDNLPSVTRKGYAFKGWYTKKSGGKKFTTKTEITKNMTVYARWTQVSAPANTTIRKLTASVKGFTVTWKKVSSVTGYEIRYSTKSSMKGYKAVTAGAKDTSNEVSKLSGSKKYYVVVYAYKTDSAGKKVYSEVSNMKSVKTK